MGLVRALSTGAVATGAVAQIGTSAAAQPTQACSQLPGVYAASNAQLQACGLSEAPLSSTTPMPGGGESYNYALPDGQTYSVIQAPAGFNPTTASPAVDAAYGVPPAPSPLSAGYAAWQTLADGTYAPVQEHPYLVVTSQRMTEPQASTSTNGSGTGAGYLETGSGWTEVQTQYEEPYLGHTHCSDPQVSFWAGIGNQPQALGQAGTASGEAGKLHQVFFENLPAGAAFPGVTASAGSVVASTVQYNGSNNWRYTIDVNGTNHPYGGTGGYDGSVVDAITERPDGAPLLNFQSINMYAAVGRGLSTMSPNETATMPGYATLGGFSAGSFTVTQNNCAG